MNEPQSKPKRRRRFLRFSLRAFLVLLTIGCVWFGWTGNRVRQKREAVAWVLRNGGQFQYDYEYDASLTGIAAEPPGPTWLRELIGIDFLSDVVKVDLSESSEVSDLRPLAGLKYLRELWLVNTAVSDLTPLASLTNLEFLSLHRTPVSDLSAIAGLTRLEYLHLKETLVSDLSPLANLIELEVLSVRNTDVIRENYGMVKRALPNCRIRYEPRPKLN